MDLSTITRTAMAYRDRITFEFIVLGTCSFFNALFCLFFLSRPHLLFSFKPSICFVTFGTFFFSLFILAYQLFLVATLWSQHEPQYTVAMCTILKCLVSAMTSSSQVLPLILIAFLHLPLGEIKQNDQCETLQFSLVMEAIRISLTLGFNVFAVLINCYICMFVRRHDQSQVDLHRRRVQLTYSLLLQSIIPIIVSVPLLAGSFSFYFGFDLPYEFVSRWYATTFLSPFLTPISSMLSLKTIRMEMLDLFTRCLVFRPGPKISNSVIA